jgi:hypothetical protein
MSPQNGLAGMATPGANSMVFLSTEEKRPAISRVDPNSTSVLCRFSDAGVKADPPAEAAGVRKAPRHEVAVGGALAGSDRYGDLRLAPRSIVGGTLSRRRLDVWRRGRWEGCLGRLSRRSERMNGGTAR